MDKAAIVILNWNGKGFLEKFLPQLCEHTDLERYKLIVADNGSKDDSVQFLESNYPKVQLIKFNENHGYAKGYKKALDLIEAEYYVLLNSDVEVTSNWVEPIIAAMDKDEQIAAAMPKILDYNQRSNFEYAGAAGGFIDKYGYPFCQGRILSSIEDDHGQFDRPREIFWASGACMFVRASAYRKAGGLDGCFFAHMEEIDLCWRFKRLGYGVAFIPESSVYHVGGGTLPNNNPFKLYLNYRNSLYMLYKNLPRKKFFGIMIIRMILDGFSAFIYLSRFSFSFFAAVFKAHIHFYSNLKMLRRKRAEFFEKVRKESFSEIYTKSIVFGFYLKRKKEFNQLKF